MIMGKESAKDAWATLTHAFTSFGFSGALSGDHPATNSGFTETKSLNPSKTLIPAQ